MPFPPTKMVLFSILTILLLAAPYVLLLNHISEIVSIGDNICVERYVMD